MSLDQLNCYRLSYKFSNSLSYRYQIEKNYKIDIEFPDSYHMNTFFHINDFICVSIPIIEYVNVDLSL